VSVGPHRYWRIVDLSIPGGGYLEISELHLYEGASKVTATLSNSVAPSFSVVSVLDDGSNFSRAYWTEATAENPSFWIQWDVGAGNDLEATGLRQAGYDNSARHIEACTLEYSDDASTWGVAGYVTGIPYPGDFALGSTYAFAAAGSSGSAASTQAKNTAVTAGRVRVSGTAAATQAKNLRTSVGKVKVSGTAATTALKNAADTDGGVKTSGTAAGAQGLNDGTAFGAPKSSGAAASAQAANTAAATGYAGNSVVGASIQAKNVGAAAGSVRISGAAAASAKLTVAYATGFAGVAVGTRYLSANQLLPNFAQSRIADERTWSIGAQIRELSFGEDRAYLVAGQSRRHAVAGESRVLPLANEDRVNVP